MGARNAVRGVLIADVVASRRASDFAAVRERVLAAASTDHRREGWIEAPYAVTAWDEFQGLASGPQHLPRMVFDLRLRFQPLELRIGLGVGEVQRSSAESLNLSATGPAFERARNALEALSGPTGKIPTRTRFGSPDGALDRMVNLIYGLHDSLAAKTSRRQWETILAWSAAADGEEAARRLGLAGPSTVSRNLRRGAYWQMIEVRDSLVELLADWHRRWRSQAST
ncbi:MAG: SatD family protein [Acidobacteriota bacterium]